MCNFSCRVCEDKFQYLNKYFKLTWLILPVVICLFRRLSHASLSLNLTMKLRNAHYNSKNSLEIFDKDTNGNSVDNTCLKSFVIKTLWKTSRLCDENVFVDYDS